MSKARTAVLCLAAIAALTPIATAAGDSETVLARHDSLAVKVDGWLKELTAAGFNGAVRLERRGTVILQKGYGWTDRSRKHPVTPKTLFYTASMTKSMTATIIMRLQEMGKLEITDEIARYFPKAPEALGKVSIQQLLTHTSGVQTKYAADGSRNGDAAVGAIFKAADNPQPGSFKYSNDNYALLAAIVEQATGSDFETALRQLLLEPAGMKSVQFWGRFDDRDRRAVAQKQSRLSKKTRRPNWGYVGSGGVYAAVADLAAWHRALQTGRILSPASLEAMWRRRLDLASGTGVGFGWFHTTTEDGDVLLWSRGTEDFGHNGLLQWDARRQLLTIVLSAAGEIDGAYANQLVGAKVQELARNR